MDQVAVESSQDTGNTAGDDWDGWDIELGKA